MFRTLFMTAAVLAAITAETQAVSINIDGEIEAQKCKKTYRNDQGELRCSSLEEGIKKGPKRDNKPLWQTGNPMMDNGHKTYSFKPDLTKGKTPNAYQAKKDKTNELVAKRMAYDPYNKNKDGKLNPSHGKEGHDHGALKYTDEGHGTPKHIHHDEGHGSLNHVHDDSHDGVHAHDSDDDEEFLDADEGPTVGPTTPLEKPQPDGGNGSLPPRNGKGYHYHGADKTTLHKDGHDRHE